jgi:hypothetical protein
MTTQKARIGCREPADGVSPVPKTVERRLGVAGLKKGVDLAGPSVIGEYVLMTDSISALLQVRKNRVVPRSFRP